MRRLSALFLMILASCSIDDNTPPPEEENENKELFLSESWETETDPFLPQGLTVSADDSHFFVAAKSGGLLVFEDSDTGNPNQVASIPIVDFGNLHVTNIFQRDNYVYLSLGDFFGGSSKVGLAIIDVSDPMNPIIMDKWESTEVVSGSAIVVVEGNYAYLGAMNFGFFILNISNPNSIVEISQHLPDINFPEESPGDVAHPNARGMAVKNNLLYLCYDAGGIRVIDVTDKQNPNEIGRFLNDAAQENTPKAYNNVIINGNYAYVAVDYCGLEIWDISDPTNAQMVGWWNPWNCDTLQNLWLNSPGHSNQMGFDVENQLMFLATGKSELSIIDVSDPQNPTLKESFGSPNNTLATWGMTLSEDNIYLLYIKALVPLYSDWTGLKKLKWELE